jgi:hypothetical protein
LALSSLKALLSVRSSYEKECPGKEKGARLESIGEEGEGKQEVVGP